MKKSVSITGSLWGESTGHFLYYIPLWGESTGHQWILSQRTCSTNNWCLFVVVSLNEHLNKHSKWSEKWIALALIWYRPNEGKIRERYKLYESNRTVDMNKKSKTLQNMCMQGLTISWKILLPDGQTNHCIHVTLLNTLRSRQMAVISQTTFSNSFSWIKIYEFHCSLFLRVQMRIS